MMFDRETASADPRYGAGASQLVERDRSDMEILTDRTRMLYETSCQVAVRLNEFLGRMGKPCPPSGRVDSNAKLPAPTPIGHLSDISGRLDDLGETLERLSDLTARLDSIG